MVGYRHRARVHIGHHDALGVGKHVKHMRAILADTEHPVDLVLGRVVSANALGALGGEPQLALLKVEAVGTIQRAQVEALERLGCHQVEYGNRVKGAKAVVRHISRAPILRGNHFVRIVAHGHARRNTQRRWINNGQRMVVLRKYEQSR